MHRRVWFGGGEGVFLGGMFCFSHFSFLFCSTGIETCGEFFFGRELGIGRYINLTWEGKSGKSKGLFVSP